MLIRGRSGSGKSALALDLMSRGCGLVADDRVELRAEGPRLLARAPDALKGLIEARGVGLLRAEALAEAEIVLLADLDAEEAERLPAFRAEAILGVALPTLRRPAAGGFAAALLQGLKGGRAHPEDPQAGPVPVGGAS